MNIKKETKQFIASFIAGFGSATLFFWIAARLDIIDSGKIFGIPQIFFGALIGAIGAGLVARWTKRIN